MAAIGHHKAAHSSNAKGGRQELVAGKGVGDLTGHLGQVKHKACEQGFKIQGLCKRGTAATAPGSFRHERFDDKRRARAW